MAYQRWHALYIRLFFTELFGRYSHLQHFVEHAPRDLRDRSPNLIHHYLSELNSVLRRLGAWGYTISDILDEALEVDELLGTFQSFLNESDKFQDTHRGLRLFATPWPESDLFQFLQQLFYERGLARRFDELQPSIVFSDEFNFLTFDLRHHLSFFPPSSALPVWALPKAESGNPLLWPVLAHEVAHSLFPEEELKKRIVECAAGAFSGADYGLLVRWGIELNADRFAYKVLGPAYLCALIYFSIFFVTDNLRAPVTSGPHESGGLHPPPETRIRLLLEEVNAAKIHEPSMQGAIENIEALYNTRKEFDFKNGTFEVEDYRNHLPSSDTAVDELWKIVKRVQTDLLPEIDGLTFDEHDLKSAARLSDRLNDNLLAASLPDSESVSKLRCTLDQIEKGKTTKEKLVKAELVTALDERPATMLEITNAGWLCKIRKMKSDSKVADLVRLDLRKSLEVMREPARQLQKSIQVALILSSVSTGNQDAD